MRTLLTVAGLLGLLGCPRGEGGSAGAPLRSLTLVEAELAAQLRAGKGPADAYCEAEIPHLRLDGSALAFHCGQVTERHQVTEDRQQGARRSLVTAKGVRLSIEQQGTQRYRVEGSPCDGAPRVYVAFEDPEAYRQEWLKAASCPTEDMKLAE